MLHYIQETLSKCKFEKNSRGQELIIIMSLKFFRHNLLIITKTCLCNKQRFFKDVKTVIFS